MGHREIRLSQVMIVKDEEENIKRALNWGKSIVWEQIVVDTGSSDRTVELAESMGARVEHYVWTSDFSAAKNYALSLCQGDWIAFLDADEYVLLEEVDKILPLLRQAEALGANVLVSAMIQADREGIVYGGGTVRRFFKNHAGMSYTGRIHEQLSCNDTLVDCDATQYLSIVHTGYAETARQKKKGRNLSILQEILRKDPGDYEMLAYLGDEYRAMGREQEAQKAYGEALRHLPEEISPENQRISSTYLYLLELLLRGGAGEDFQSLYDEACRLFPEDGDFPYLVGWHTYLAGEYGNAIPYLEEALDKIERYGTFRKALYLSACLPEAWQALGYAYLQTGQKEKAVSTLTVLLRQDKEFYSALLLLIQAFLDSFQFCGEAYTAEIFSFFGKIYDFQQRRDRMFLYRAFLEIGEKGLLSVAEKRFPLEERMAVERAVLSPT